jgi:phosphatidylserine/phosphatidylglycerophosphate/cardiolipin synthase-like enzyme
MKPSRAAITLFVALLSLAIATRAKTPPPKAPLAKKPAAAAKKNASAVTTGVVKFIPDPAYLAEAQRLLNGATTSILVMQFNFETGSGATQQLANLIVAKKALKPTVLLEAKGFGADKKNPVTAAYLKKNGVTDVALITGKPAPNGNHVDDGILHAKVLMVDGSLILAGSTNWTNKSIGSNNETNLSVRSPKLAQALAAYANQIKSGGQSLVNGSTKDGDITLYTDSAYEDAIVGFIGRAGAGDKLDCSMYFFNVNDATDGKSSGLPNPAKPAERTLQALVAAKTKGAAIRLVFDGAAFDRSSPIGQGNDRAAALLKQQGVTGLFRAEPGKITHQKFCVLIPKAGQPAAILGSTNWNLLDVEYNHQVNWAVENNAGNVATDIEAYFNKLPKTNL